jgi:hypothetical protein
MNGKRWHALSNQMAKYSITMEQTDMQIGCTVHNITNNQTNQKHGTLYMITDLDSLEISVSWQT